MPGQQTKKGEKADKGDDPTLPNSGALNSLFKGKKIKPHLRF